MSLRAFHIFFIAASALMSLGVAAWGVGEYLQRQSVGGLGLAIACFLLAIALVIYGVRAYRKLMELDG